ncbi:MAG TPA: aminotransferase class III-fold pyridoxal phosphate-dependent enzyme [Gemmatimonadota bacterium]|nr:aminotransferase class III-fold pyridoxal phosphate-dependent enzyme [Gemmatimonadota bacterium]
MKDPTGSALPRIAVPPPGPESRRLAGLVRRFEPAPAAGIIDGQVPIAWARARGANVVDPDGNRYVDMTGGFGAAAVGHRNPRVVAAVARAADRLLHGLADAAPHPARLALAGMLSLRGPIRNGRVYFASSGAEAVDIALKTAHLATGRAGVVAFDAGYHGTSLGALRATGRPAFREGVEEALAPATLRVPFADCYRCPYRLTYPACGLACLDAALAEVDAWNGDLARPRLGAWIVEPIPGREGVIVPPRGYLKALGEAARARGVLVVADEILTGGGRTGRWWASGPLEPDLVTVGKAITGGLPLAATIGRPGLMEVWEGAGEAHHATTTMAHPVAAAAAIAALGQIQHLRLPERARAIGRRLGGALRRLQRRHAVLGDVRGVGAMWGLDFVSDRARRTPDPAVARAVSDSLAARGYLALAGGRYGNVIVLTPPLVITARQVDGFLAALEGALAASA